MAPEAPEPIEAEGLREVRSLDLAALRPTIQRVCGMAAALCGAPHAYVVLNEDGQIWHSAFSDLEESLVDAHDSVSMRNENGIWLEDALVSNPDHPWTAGPPYARFYCATPLRLSSGLRIGALCVLSPEPKAHDAVAEAHLADCAALLSEAVERLRAERARLAAARETRAAVALKEAIMRSAPVAMAMVDRDMRYVYVNSRWCKDTGVSQERAIGAHVGELFPESYAELKDTYERCLAGEVVWSDRVKIPNPRGPDRWLRAEVGPWRDGDGEVAGLIAMSHDISDVIRSLDRAERSEQRLKLAVEIADMLVWEADYETRELKLEGAIDTFGSDGGITFDMVANDPWFLVHPEDRDRAIETWDRCAAEGEPFRTEYRMLGPAGREVWAFSGAELSLTPDGQPRRLLGVLKNITDRKKSEVQ
eukprot:gene15089-14889_t